MKLWLAGIIAVVVIAMIIFIIIRRNQRYKVKYKKVVATIKETQIDRHLKYNYIWFTLKDGSTLKLRVHLPDHDYAMENYLETLTVGRKGVLLYRDKTFHSFK